MVPEEVERVTRHFCYEGDDCLECTDWEALKRRPASAVDVSWVTYDLIGSDWAWPWWLAVPAAWLRRMVRL